MKCRILFLGLCFLILTVESEDKFDGIRKAFTEYLITAEIPSNIFTPYIDDDTKCDICISTAQNIIDARHSNIPDEELAELFTVLCQQWSVTDETMCNQIVTNYFESFVYILDNNPNLTGERVCALPLQGTCDSGDNYEWSVEIPDGPGVPRPTPNATSSITILQLSDIHYDPYYTEGKTDQCVESVCCQFDQRDAGANETSCGFWSAYNKADSPWHLVTDTIRQVNTHSFDFVYYTGDIISHRTWATSVEGNSRDIRKIYQILHDLQVPVFPIFGNHESHPVNSWPSDGVTNPNISITWLYDIAVEEWSHWLPDSALETVKKGGYYTVSPLKGFRIIALNSNVCYLPNWWLVNNDVDPFNQLQWLVKVLLDAESSGESVHILSHIPGGQSDCLYVWQREFRRVVNRFANTITAQFNGHTHKDEFVIFYNRSEPTQPINIAFNGAAVTPFSDANPSYKLYKVDLNAFTVLDFEEWTFNLTEANLDPKLEAPWYRLYSIKDAYGMESLDPDSFDKIVFKMAENHTLLDQYFRFRFRNGDTALDRGCGSTCQKNNLCRMVTSEYTDTTQCDVLKQIYDENS